MKKNLLKAMLVAMGMVIGIQTSQAVAIEATLDFTAAIQGGSNAAGKSYNEVTHYYNNWGTTAWVAQAYAGFSFTIPEGMAVSGATLAFTSNAARGNRTIDVNIMSGLDFDYENLELKTKAAAGTNLVSLAENDQVSTKTVDCTTAVKGFIEQEIYSVVFVFSNAAAGGTLQGYGSDQKPTLTLELADASTQTYYTVKFVDGEDNELKESIRRSGTIGNQVDLEDSDLNSIKTSEGVKYIWQEDNSPLTLTADESANVITVKFVEAPKWHYTLQTNLGTGNLAEGYEYADEVVNVGYPRYYLYTRNGNLYEAARSQSSAGWYLYGIEMTEPDVYADVNYNMENPVKTNVVFYQELENVEGMTYTTANLHNVRCSNGAGGYNGTESDITLTTLQPGNYIIHFAIRGSNNGYTLPLLVGGERYEYVTDGNLQEFNLELKLTSSADVVIPAGSGNSVNVYDFMDIQSVPETINWTVKGSEGTTIFDGASYQGVAKAIGVPKFILASDGTLYQTGNNGDAGWYLYNFIPETEGQEFTVEYEAGPQGVVLYAEAESVEGMKSASGSNANVRCSMAAGGYNDGEGEVLVGTVPESGEYVVVFAVWGGADTEMTVNAGGTPFSITTTGSLTEQTSEPISLTAGAAITIPVCGNSSHVIDYVYVQKADYATAIKGVKQVNAEDNAIYNLAGQQVKSAQKGIFIQNGKKVVK